MCATVQFVGPVHTKEPARTPQQDLTLLLQVPKAMNTHPKGPQDRLTLQARQLPNSLTHTATELIKLHLPLGPISSSTTASTTTAL